jgi:hypothetical protein
MAIIVAAILLSTLITAVGTRSVGMEATAPAQDGFEAPAPGNKLGRSSWTRRGSADGAQEWDLKSLNISGLSGSFVLRLSPH